ncbi:MAG: hypothetical protein QOG63_57 [Thermoleophilaceae bacterium]|nr:hypothetical protein [Thermoleophilaceae bacterium]
MTRVVWIVMIGLVLALGIPAALMPSDEQIMQTFPAQALGRLVLVPTEKTRRIIVPPCGTGVSVATRPPDVLAKTPGSVVFVLQKTTATDSRLVLVPRCRASQGAAPSEGAQLPAAAFILPVGANITAGRGGSAEAGTELVQSQLVVTNGSSIADVVVPQCIESEAQARRTATGRALILKPQPGRRSSVVGPPC